MTNLILNVDSYKASHYLQYPPNTSRIYSYIESRGVSAPLPNDTEIVFFGLQAFLREYLTKPITYANVSEASAFFAKHGLPFNAIAWYSIVAKHGGYLPVTIEAMPEGTPLKPGICQVQVYNTDPELPWLTSYIETSLLRAIWYPSTVATISREAKKIISLYMNMTAENPEKKLDFQLHDFGARGVSSEESATLGGMAHLINFKGSDTISGILGAIKYYDAEELPGYSIPAAEHSTITSWGKENEEAAYSNMLDKFAGLGKVLAVVSDSYDLFNAITNIWGESLKEKVLNSGAVVVIRPDSGKPIEIVLKTLKLLGEKFGYEKNEKNYKVLNPSIRVIQGDGVNLESIEQILLNMTYEGWSAENVAFGMGGALLQSVNRDTLKYAMKTSARIDDINIIHSVFKDPITDSGKRSKSGILGNYILPDDGFKRINDSKLVTMPMDLSKTNQLEVVYSNGTITRSQTFEDIRNRAKI